MTDDQLRQAYGSGMSLTEIRNRFGISFWKTRKVCKDILRTRTEGLRIRWNVMPNEFEVKGDITELHMTYKGERKTALMDTEDLEKVRSVNATWVAHFNPSSKSFYGKAGKRTTGLYTSLHQFILGKKDGMMIDHINQDTLDNRKENLRFVDRSTNAHNSFKERTGRALPRGVRFQNGRYLARIIINKKAVNIGWYETEEEASEAYLQ